MKIKSLLLVVIIFVFKSSVAQQWLLSSQPLFGMDINSIQIFKPASVLLAGGSSSFYRAFYSSADYGATWPVLGMYGSTSVMSVAFADSLNGVGAGFNGTLIKTADGGATWTNTTAPLVTDFNKVFYTSRQTVFAVGGNRSNDSLRVILKSTDGGNNWNVVFNQTGKWLKSVCFTDTLNGIAVGDSGAILKTINGGNAWVPVTAPVQRDFNAISFINDTTGFIVGGKEANDSVRTILKTTNRGAAWSVIKDEANGWLKDVTFINQSTGYVAGENGGVLKTTNGGQTWNQETINGATGSDYFNAISFHDPDFGVVAGNGGRVFVWTNATAPEVHTWGCGPVDSLYAFLHARINTHGFPVTYAFNYSTDSSFATTATSFSQYLISDSLTTINLQLAGLTPGTNYYYSVVVHSILGTFYGDTLNFTTLFRRAIFKTLAPDSVTGTSAHLKGYVNKFPVPVNLFFDYDTTPAFNHYIAGSPVSINDTFSHIINATVNSLLPGKTYYYRLRGVSSSNVSYFGDTYSFYTGSAYLVFQTLAATRVTGTSAMLSGIVWQDILYTTVDFEYGTSPLLGQGSNVAAVITDTSYFPLSVNLSGLQPHTLYFFRLRGQTGSGNLYGDIKCFYTGTSPISFQTLPPTNTTTSSAQLNGIVNKFNLPVNLSFEYGTSPNLGTQVNATPLSVNDTLLHNVSASLTGLQPNTLYYYRLKGTTAYGDFFGDLTGLDLGGTFFTRLQTLPAEHWDTAIHVNGVIEGFQVPAAVSFEYGTTPALGSTTTGGSVVTTDTAIHFYGASLFQSSVQPHQLYYFRVKAVTNIGVFYGDILNFYSDSIGGGFQTMLASGLTGSSAQLNGIALDVTIPVNVSFQYGTSPFFGDSIVAVPGYLSDSLQHNFSATISGLAANRYYYYRLKGETSDSMQFYGNTIQFFNGTPQVPNWDFQLWQDDTLQLPVGWNFLGNTVMQVPGHSGNYAIEIYGQNAFINGVVTNIPGGLPEFGGGCPFNARPDSVTCWLNYNIAPGDTALMLVYLSSGNNPVSYHFYPISGSSGGVFNRVSIPIIYDSGAMPDSLVIAFVSSNIYPHPYFNASNYLIVDDIGFVPAVSGVVNPGFENWFSLTTKVLLDWDYSQLKGTTPGTGSTGPLVTQTYFTPPYDFAVEVHNILWNGYLINGIISTGPGVLNDEFPSFAVSDRHQYLTGYYKFFPVKGDTMEIAAYLYNNGQPIANAFFKQTDSITQFTPFSVPLSYDNNNQLIPDSGSITVKAYTTQARGLSTVVLDKLNFDGFALVNNIWSSGSGDGGLKIYPNPASDRVIVEIENNTKEGDYVQLFALNGRKVEEIQLSAGQNKIELALNNLASGFYLVNIKAGNRISSGKIVVVR